MDKVEYYRPNWSWNQDAPLSQMVRTGDYLWLSGQIPVNSNGEVVGIGDIEAQARQIFSNMREVLALAGCDLKSIIRLTNYFTVSLTDEKVKHAFWNVRREMFGDHRPASTGMQVASLGRPGVMLEIDAVAWAPARSHQPA